MTIFRYDRSWEGLLTALYEAYSRHEFPDKLLCEGETAPMFVDGVFDVYSNPDRATRVWRGLQRRTSRRVCNLVLHAWLSEESGVDELIFRYLRKIFDGATCGREAPQGFAPPAEGIVTNFADPDVIAMHKIALKVAREGEHVRQFLRFQKATDGSYFAPVAPKYNALPLAVEYLVDRFADQQWLVYDTARHYGYLFDCKEVKEVTMDDDAHLIEGRLSDEVMAADEKLFQTAWRGYLGALTIRERLNPRLQRQHMPRRFWKYLTEKQ